MARPSQGEALTTWALWAAISLCVVVTYSRLDPALTYHVSRDGLAGGLSRAVTLVNFPIGLVAIALVLVAVPALTARAWWIGGPAIALCSTIPLFNEQGNLDAHWGNAIPAVGVALALGLTVAATTRAGAAFAPRQRFDVARVAAGRAHARRQRTPGPGPRLEQAFEPRAARGAQHGTEQDAGFDRRR